MATTFNLLIKNGLNDFYRGSILKKIIKIPILNSGITSRISAKKKNKKNNDAIIEKVIVSAFDNRNSKLFTNLD